MKFAYLSDLHSSTKKKRQSRSLFSRKPKTTRGGVSKFKKNNYSSGFRKPYTLRRRYENFKKYESEDESEDEDESPVLKNPIYSQLIKLQKENKLLKEELTKKIREKLESNDSSNDNSCDTVDAALLLTVGLLLLFVGKIALKS